MYWARRSAVRRATQVTGTSRRAQTATRIISDRTERWNRRPPAARVIIASSIPTRCSTRGSELVAHADPVMPIFDRLPRLMARLDDLQLRQRHRERSLAPADGDEHLPP